MTATATAAEEAFVPWFHPFTIIVLVFLTVITLALLFLLPSNHKKQKDRAHAVITGGSSGIGLALAHECVKQGFATITLIARDDVKLQAARAELLAVAKSGKTAVVTYSFDVSDAKACHEQAKIILQQGGSPTVLLNNAGTSSSASFADTDVDEFSRLVTINYLGCVYLTQALLPSMRGGGTVVFTSSMAGQVGVYGNTAYSASKFALRGYCEALQMETRRDDIRVVMAFPPDTDTPGYKLENETKPKETMAISEAGGLFTPEKVASTMLAAALSPNPPFSVYFGLEGWMLATLTAGMGPVHGLVDGLAQVLLMGILRLVSIVYLWDFARIIKKCREDDKPKQE